MHRFVDLLCIRHHRLNLVAIPRALEFHHYINVRLSSRVYQYHQITINFKLSIIITLALCALTVLSQEDGSIVGSFAFSHKVDVDCQKDCKNKDRPNSSVTMTVGWQRLDNYHQRNYVNQAGFNKGPKFYTVCKCLKQPPSIFLIKPFAIV